MFKLTMTATGSFQIPAILFDEPNCLTDFHPNVSGCNTGSA
jgi:hypothetical protein